MAEDAGAKAPDDKDPPRGQSSFEKVEAKNTSLPSELLGYLGKNKKWWLLPIMVVFVGIGVIVLLSQTAAAPFIYTFF